MANVSSSNTTTLYSTTQTTPIQQGAPVATGQVNDANFTTLYTAGQQVTPNANLVVPGTLTVNGCNILTNCSAFNILPTTATTVNLGGAATSVNIGANSGVTLINNQLATANYTFPVADGTANQVLTTDGAGNVYWALPGGGGSQFGNITIGIVDDNTISTTTGDLILDSATNNVNVTADLNLTGAFKINGATSGYSQFSVPATGSNIGYVLPGTQGAFNTTLVNDGAGNLTWGLYNPFDQSLNTTDIVQFTSLSVGGGIGNYFQTQPGVSVTFNIDNITMGDGTSIPQGFNINGGIGHTAVFYFDPATDSFVFSADVGGNRLLLNPTNADFKTPIKISGSSSGSSTFAAPATGSTLSYVLPGTAGAANTVLTNDGSGNLSWALPGGGGSQFGNITVGIVTDNTISTTTGDLILDSATNLVNVTADLTVTGDIQFTGGDLTSTNTTTNFSYTGTGSHSFIIDNINTASGNTKYISIGTSGQSSSTTVVDIGNPLATANSTVTLYNAVNVNGTLRLFNTGTVNNTGFYPNTSGGTINYFLPNAQGAANTVLTNDGSGNLTWALPGGGGSQFGNITVGIVTDNTISTTTGDLILDSATNQVVISADTVVNGNFTANDLYARSNVYLNIDQTPSQLAQLIAYSGVTGTSVSDITWNGTNWAAANDFNVNGSSTLSSYLQLNGSSSGYSRFTAPATGANILYTLPNAQGAANTVLTNDGSGNLTWALPGGGGSTFGNVSIGVVTDNTISTTTGDLNITSTTGVINLDTYTTFTDGRTTTVSTSTLTLDSLPIATYQSASYTITVKDNVTNATQFTKIDLLHDGAVAYINQYSNMTSAADLATFSATISGANAVLQITAASANNTQFTYSRIATKV